MKSLDTQRSVRLFLQDMLEDIRFEDLPANWQSFDLVAFSSDKRLWDYQQQAVRNAIRILWKYYEDFENYQQGEPPSKNDQRKQKLAQWYRDNGLNENMGFNLSNSRLQTLLEDYYPIEDGKVSFQNYINRACFWMATGSGKTLVIVKLIEVLWRLIQRGEIPPYDILVLTHRDDLIQQLKTHVEDFNATRSAPFIRLRELREYADAKHNPSLLRDDEVVVFYYRSDNLSDEQKEKIVDFRNYDNEGRWYVLLDEAHKGDKEESKRQHIYAILSRNGFLFNFSATFTDPRDLVTTAFNFNLSEFIKKGYGKHIAVLEQETQAFRDEEDYSGEEKQKIVLKALILLAYAHIFAGSVRGKQPAMYHKPLLLVLVHSVNTEDADLKLFFRQIERIGKGEVEEGLWQAAKDELWQELKERPPFMFEDERVEMNEDVFQGLSHKDILQWVYNAEKPGEIEILVRPSNRQELAFKLKTSDRPFALVKIGDISGWLKDELVGYEINQTFDDESYFQRLNEEESDINILMGSRSFYEGWDSNRPNVIVYINIGTGTEAKKFILQSVGRGVRIEPLKNKRKRLLPLFDAKEVGHEVYHAVKDIMKPLETLFIFGTNRAALKTVIGHLEREGGKGERHQLSLFENPIAKKQKLLIPVYRQATEPMVHKRELAKFEIAQAELDLLKRYMDYIPDDRVLLALYDAELAQVRLLRESLKNANKYYKCDGRNYKNLDLLVQRVMAYLSIVPEDFERLKELEDEIQHFKKITVELKDIGDLKTKIEQVKDFAKRDELEQDLQAKYGVIPPEEYDRKRREIDQMVKEAKVNYEMKTLRIRHVANHYYIPIILSDEKERINYIKHIIQTQSEVEFINCLEEYTAQPNHHFRKFDWWMFSKLDESLDEVYIPYYSPKSNAIARFKPDFIFWLKKGNNYYIVFVDPKGTEHIDWQRKAEGYRMIFEENGSPKVIHHCNDLNVYVLLRFYTKDANKLPQGEWRRFWFDRMEELVQ